MKVTGVNEKEKSTLELIVEVEPAVFEEALEQTYRKNRRGIMVPGFRPGKAPRKIIERMFGAEIFHEEAINDLAPGLFEQAVEEKALKTVGNPSVENIDIADDKTLTLTFVTAVHPTVTLGKYKGLEAEKTVETVKKKDIDTELDGLRERNARIQPVERKAKKGDIAVIDFEGFLEDKPFEGGKGEKFELLLGSGSFVPGFEEQVVGMKAGDEKDVAVTFPEDYAEGLAGKDVVFKVKCQEVKEKILPDLDDEFAKDVSEFDTLEDYKKSIKERIKNERTERAENLFKDAVMKQAVENMEADVPAAMVEHTLKNMMQEFFFRIESQGMNPNQYLSMMGMTPEGFMENTRPAAEARVKTGLLLDAVVEAENIAVDEAELEAEYVSMAEQYDRDIEEIKKNLPPEGVTGDLKRKKAAELIETSAKVKKKEAAKKGEETEADEEVEKPEKPKKAPAAKKGKKE